jgi:hypothetical protein
MPTKTTHPVAAKKAATKAAGHDKPRSNAAPKEAAATSGPRPRLTEEWKDSKGKAVALKATVTFDGKSWTVKSRFTSRTKEGRLVPCLALAPKSGKDKKGKHTPAKAVTLV